ncbi:MAG TPA: extracellular solute-binding protein [Pirellulales bacterium]|nr:extracellular solute-binding protein [Pirellulales bacterium]
MNLSPLQNNATHFGSTLLGVLALFAFGCGESSRQTQVTLWHQMTVGERELLEDQVRNFEKEHPEIRVKTLYKETEELRSGFQAAALAGTGPELVYGPSDSLGAFATMGIVRDMAPWMGSDELEAFIDQSLTFLTGPGHEQTPWLVQVGDRVGNHLALIYNRNLIDGAPENTDQLIRIAKEATLDKDGDGRVDQYGLVFNFVEPFFVVPFITGHGGWVFDSSDTSATPMPALDTPEVAAALQFVRDLQQKHKVIPAGCDYDTADALFKNGQAAMIINGDWSWSEYLKSDTIDAVVAPLPVVSSTGIPMRPMVASKGYSLNANAQGREADAAMALVQFLTGAESQRAFMDQMKTLPSRAALLQKALSQEDATLRASAAQKANGLPMPVVAELRAVWDSMRPHYQALLGGSTPPKQASAQMQAEAVEKIRRMNERREAGATAWILQLLAVLLVAGFLYWQRHTWGKLLGDWRKNRIAYLLVAPAILVLLLTIIYPFLYNVVLSFSNMSLRHFQDWQVTGLQNYQQVFSETTFFWVLWKTILWTVICVFFSVVFGLLLAAALNGPVRGKGLYQVLLILPWAIPAYITALSWRGMFDYEYGAVNIIANDLFGLPMVNWLGEPNAAFAACIITNIWLGFPFMMVIALGGMQGIPGELYEAARIDRVSRFGQFWNITLPMLRPVLIPAITLGTIWTFNNLNVIWLVSNGGEPSDKTHILVSYVYKAVFNLYQYGYGAALSMIIFFMLLAFALFFLHRTRATEAI